MTIAVLWFWIYLHVKLEKQATISVFNWIKLCSSLPRAEQKLSRCREREMCECARWTETEQTRRERDVWVRWRETEADTERDVWERERCVCARAEQKRSRRREICVSARAEQKLKQTQRERDVWVRALNRNWSRRRERESEREVCVCALNRNWSRRRERESERGLCWTETEADAERERGVCARWTETEADAERERGVRARWTETEADAERERCECARWTETEADAERERAREVCARGLHGLKTEARTRPVPEIVWPNPTRPAQLNLEPEPDPKSPPTPPPPQRITKKKKV